jgi:hypothetical protein
LEEISALFLRLGLVQAMMCDRIAGRKSYNEFLTLWKDADPDIPIYKPKRPGQQSAAQRRFVGGFNRRRIRREVVSPLFALESELVITCYSPGSKFAVLLSFR